MYNDDMNDTIKTLEKWENIAFDYEDVFLKTFGNSDAWILTQISWDSSKMRFVYILDCGQHIADSVPIERWFDFMKTSFKVKGARSKQ